MCNCTSGNLEIPGLVLRTIPERRTYIFIMIAKSRKVTPPDVATLTKAQAKVELKRLALEIESHDKHYYQDDAPKISDADYDALRKRANTIEARFPELVTSESPSQKIGAQPSGRFAKVRHAVPMLSLGNAFSDEDRDRRGAEDRRPLIVAAL